MHQDVSHSVNMSFSSRAYPSMVCNHTTSIQQHPSTAYPSSQHPCNYTTSQYSQSSPSTSHHPPHQLFQGSDPYCNIRSHLQQWLGWWSSPDQGPLSHHHLLTAAIQVVHKGCIH